jgi:large subunit ribosomal protein L19
MVYTVSWTADCVDARTRAQYQNRLGYDILSHGQEKSPAKRDVPVHHNYNSRWKVANMDAAQLIHNEPNSKIPDFGPGDTVRVNFRIREGDRERVQAFQGVVIRRQNGKGPAANFTVRRIAGGGVGVERIFPLHSPLIDSLEVTRQGAVRRAKLYYLRGLHGRAARIKEKSYARRQ